MKIRELLERTDFEAEALMKKQRDDAYARAKWHKEMALKYKGKDDEDSKAAHQAHDTAEFDWIRISQEHQFKNPRVAANMAKRAEEDLAKSHLAKADVDNSKYRQ